jgi:hypothetical protein
MGAIDVINKVCQLHFGQFYDLITRFVHVLLQMTHGYETLKYGSHGYQEIMFYMDGGSHIGSNSDFLAVCLANFRSTLYLPRPLSQLIDTYNIVR